MRNKKAYNLFILIYKMILCNLRIIFANKFIWFLAGAILFWMGLSVIYVLSTDMTRMSDLYEVFMIFGLLLVFYPSVFGIQNDQDARTIEILFGIPDYRYKIWLVRIILIFAIAYLIMIVFTFFSSLLILKFNFLKMSVQVMVPVLFLGMLAFALSTVIRNGNGTAVVLMIIGFIFLIMSDPLRRSQWNLFLNPFVPPYGMNEVSWEIISLKNRIFMSVGSVVFLLVALFNLQKREKFI